MRAGGWLRDRKGHQEVLRPGGASSPSAPGAALPSSPSKASVGKAALRLRSPRLAPLGALTLQLLDRQGQ